MNHGLSLLMVHLPEMLDQVKDPGLHGQFIIGTFKAKHFYQILDPDKSIGVGCEHFQVIKDVDSEGKYCC
jgi:hypothetical protein